MDAPKTTLEPGTEFQSFWVTRLIGRGGVGEVYEISNKGKLEALKVIQAKWLGEEILKRRMMDEGEALVRIKHPNVVDVYETGVTPDGQVWIRMELLTGETLREVMHRRGLISVALAVTYMRSAAHAAHQCHVIGAVHRDIKPENLFITNPAETVKLLDFGIAKLYGSPDTADGQRHGTPLYMAPEQIRGHRVTPATDVYSLGLVTYELLCGAHPFVDDARAYDLYALYWKHFSEVPVPLTSIGIPKEISDVVARALAKEPKERYRNGLEFAEALWSAWCVVRERDPGWDTEPGEPTRDELLERPEDGLSFGTGPSDGRSSSPSPSQPSRVSRPSRISQVHRALGRAKTEPLPTLPREPEVLAAFLAERGSRPPPGPPTVTERLPEAERDPSCTGKHARLPARTTAPIRLAPVIELPTRSRFVPVQATVPLALSRAEARAPAPVEVAPPALVPVRADERAPERELARLAVTEPYLPPPQPVPRDSGVYAQKAATRAAPEGEPPTRPRPWAEGRDLAEAGIRCVPGVDVHAWNPRRAGLFMLPEPLLGVAKAAKSRRRRTRVPLRIEHAFMVVAAISVALAVLFLWLHLTRTREAGASSTPGTVARPLPMATAEPVAARAASPAPSRMPSTGETRATARKLPLPSAPSLRPQALPSGAPKRTRLDGEVIDPWAQ